jgi:hypothetical protein
MVTEKWLVEEKYRYDEIKMLRIELGERAERIESLKNQIVELKNQLDLYRMVIENMNLRH